MSETDLFKSSSLDDLVTTIGTGGNTIIRNE